MVWCGAVAGTEAEELMHPIEHDLRRLQNSWRVQAKDLASKRKSLPAFANAPEGNPRGDRRSVTVVTRQDDPTTRVMSDHDLSTGLQGLGMTMSHVCLMDANDEERLSPALASSLPGSRASVRPHAPRPPVRR